MSHQSEYNTMVEALEDLKKEGYTHDFNMHNNALHANSGEIKLSPKDFQIDRVIRFEGMTDPGDMSVLYAISAPAYNVKGTFVNAYGTYADDISEELLKKLNTPS
ncbi:MAG TPA: phosphoribosylpyrophosphate synthetase [Sphingobacteriaceae bacterium]